MCILPLGSDRLIVEYSTANPWSINCWKVSAESTYTKSKVSPLITIIPANLSAAVPVSLGGTGATTASAGLNALLPSQTGNANLFLKTDGAGNVTWAAAGAGAGHNVPHPNR